MQDKSGSIHSVSVSGGDPAAYVNIDWEAFVDNFANTNVKRKGNVYRTTTNTIEYSAKNTAEETVLLVSGS